jgi:4a-hydroxytetrahydrobiopterin dehydratase
MDFAIQVGNAAEEEGHHPDVTFGWGYCTVKFQTHKIKGLHENDFIMAAKVNELAG